MLIFSQPHLMRGDAAKTPVSKKNKRILKEQAAQFKFGPCMDPLLKASLPAFQLLTCALHEVFVVLLGHYAKLLILAEEMLPSV
jgi:hypothetical protein